MTALSSMIGCAHPSAANAGALASGCAPDDLLPK